MAALTAKRRKALPRSAFVYPSTRSYPIDTPARARNALARAAQPQTRGSYATVARKVRARYGSRIASVGTAAGRRAAAARRRSATSRRTARRAAPRRSMTSTRSIKGRRR